MRFILIFLTLFSSQVFANSTLLVKGGWQLIGLSTSVENLDLFEAKNVEQVWYFSAKSQKWLGYSPDKLVQKKIDDKDFGKIESLKSWHGFWIKSKQEWMLTLEDTDANKSVPHENNISLEIGWNLISLPINSAVSPQIFDDVSIWKYSQNEWKFFGDNEENQDFPTISHISNSDGIWVKSDKKQTLLVSKNSSRLHSFENMEQVKAYVKDMILVKDRPYFGYHPMGRMEVGGEFDAVMADAPASSKTADEGVSNATGTNLQESDVDESDILKHDGKNIFYVDGQNVNITTFSRILSGEKKPLKVMALGAGKNVNSLYLVDDKLVVLSSMSDYDIYTKDRLLMPYPSGKAKMSVDTYNVKDISNIEKVGSFVIDGSIKDSRVVDGKLILISSFNPYLKKEYPKIYAGVSDCKNYDYNERIVAKCYGVFRDNDGKFYRYDYENPTIISENLVPMIEKNGDKNVSLLIPSTFYVPSKKDQEYSITTVSKIDIEGMKLEDTSSILGYQSAVYASSKALYLVSDKYPIYNDFNNYRHRSAIYKFQINDELIYKGMGFVDGSALNQFSLSEYDDVLRIATTEGTSWGGKTKNSIFTLQENEGILEQLGYLGGLGKKGEIIYSVRFMGKKGYVVTFEKTDPFYTLDLSDPANPLKIGELEIEGFSSYLHPIGDDLIMGVGRDANRKLKLELFDISTFSKPDSVDEYVFDTKGYFYSELERNHKALAFRKSDNLFTVPFSGGDYRLNNYGNYLGVFKVEDNQFKVYNNIVDDFSFNRYSSLNRGIIFDKDGETYVAYLVNGLATFRTLTSLEKE